MGLLLLEPLDFHTVQLYQDGCSIKMIAFPFLILLLFGIMVRIRGQSDKHFEPVALNNITAPSAVCVIVFVVSILVCVDASVFLSVWMCVIGNIISRELQLDLHPKTQLGLAHPKTPEPQIHSWICTPKHQNPRTTARLHTKQPAATWTCK